MNQTPIDGEFGLDYQVFVMRQMIAQLPPKMAKPFDGQLNSIAEALKNRGKIIREAVIDNLDDAKLAIKALEFDLQATRRERDTLRDRLDGIS